MLRRTGPVIVPACTLSAARQAAELVRPHRRKTRAAGKVVLRFWVASTGLQWRIWNSATTTQKHSQLPFLPMMAIQFKVSLTATQLKGPS